MPLRTKGCKAAKLALPSTDTAPPNPFVLRRRREAEG